MSRCSNGCQYWLKAQCDFIREYDRRNKLDQHHHMLTTAELQVHIHCFVNRCMTTKNNKYPGAIPPLLLPAVYTTPTALSSYQAGHKHFTVARLMFMSPCMATTQTAYAMFTWATASSSSRHARVWHTTVRWHKVCKTVEFCADEHCAMLSNEHHAHS